MSGLPPVNNREHGGGLDAAIAEYGGLAKDWIDLSTGINPTPYPLPDIPETAWHRLPDADGFARLYSVARGFWHVPDDAGMIASAGVSAIIASLPRVAESLDCPRQIRIDTPTYNEYATAFSTAGWQIESDAPASVRIIVHPNNPDGGLTSLSVDDIKSNIKNGGLVVIDESFCDLTPNKSLIDLTRYDNVIVLKGLGKFWGLAGLRLGFAIGQPALMKRLDSLLGPWAISGPAQIIGAGVLQDTTWADKTRARLHKNAGRLDDIATANGLTRIGGTDLFRLYSCESAPALKHQLAKHAIWSRVFSYNKNWIRLGLPADIPANWHRLETALETALQTTNRSIK